MNAKNLGNYQLHSLRYLLSSGGLLPQRTLQQLMEAFPHAEIISAYRLTEASSQVSHGAYQKGSTRPLGIRWNTNANCRSPSDERGQGDVLRIEPPLVSGLNECAVFVEALERALNILERGDTARLLGLLIGADVSKGALATTSEKSPQPVYRGRKRSLTQASEKDSCFAFLLHLNETSDYMNIDPSLSVFSEEQLIQLWKRGVGLLEPSPIGEVLVESRTGQKAYGEFIMPYSAKELLEMPYERALSEITVAVGMAKKHGAKIVGLGGFTSIVTQGGLALRDVGLSPLTTGNSYTAAAGRKAVEMAFKSRGYKVVDGLSCSSGGRRSAGTGGLCPAIPRGIPTHIDWQPQASRT